MAGPTHLEANPLSEPMRSIKSNSKQSPSKQMQDYDLNNPDVQYERYKDLMSRQFYNNHANSMQVGFNMSTPHTLY